jgi:hypothetical protein
MDFDDWRSAKGSPDPQKGYITMAKTDSESMLLEPSQPQLYEAVLVKPVPAEEDVSFLQKSSKYTIFSYGFVHVTVCGDAGLSALANHVCMRMQHCILSHACIAVPSALPGCAVTVKRFAVKLLINTSLACNMFDRNADISLLARYYATQGALWDFEDNPDYFDGDL